MFIAKNVAIRPPTTEVSTSNGGSDRHPVFVTITVTTVGKSFKNRQIRRRQSRNPRAVDQRAAVYKEELPDYFEAPTKADSPEALDHNLQSV